MPRLVVIADQLRAERKSYELRAGETLARALMRLWPHGLDGAWRIYRDEVCEDNELPAVDLPYTVAVEGETYLIVRHMGAGGLLPFLGNLVVSFLLAKAVEMLMPVRRQHVWGPGIPDIISPNNMLAGQSNQLRPGARVPEILGRVRAFPDLLIRAVDTYTESNQTIQQVFVLGMGAYDVEDAKLGETPLASMIDGDKPRGRLRVVLPGEPAPDMYVMRVSPEVQGISLISDIAAHSTPATGADFIAATKQVRTPERLLATVEAPLVVSESLFNDGVFWVTGVPPDSQTTGPYLYTLDGPVVDEEDSNASIGYPPEIHASTKTAYTGAANPYDIAPPHDGVVELRQVTSQIFEVGDLVSLHLATGEVYHGRAVSAIWPIPLYSALLVSLLDPYGFRQHFVTRSNVSTEVHAYRTAGMPTRAAGDPAPRAGESIENAPTPWYAIPLANADEVWVDIEFPQGLAKYLHGSRGLMIVEILVEFKRAPATTAQASAVLRYEKGTATPLRFTKPWKVADLIAKGLPATGAVIEVRLTRTTDFQPDDEGLQIVQDTRWARLAAVKLMEREVYEKATVLFLDLSNLRGASSLGETSLSVVATRRLKTWSDTGGWSAEESGTDRWADNFVARCLARDGAHRSESEIDLAGIYKLQEYLDKLDDVHDDGHGKQGKIGLTLDAMQDVDAELAQVADVVRAVVYRVGRKLFVSRDQAYAAPIALFNARTKAPAGESVSVRMTADADNDCVIIQWIDEPGGWKRREYQYPPPAQALGVNPFRVGVIACNWEQAYRRALFEWNRLKYRRENMSCDVTEDGRIVRPGDVVNMTDDIANLATFAGEVLAVDGAVLTLDRNVTFGAGAHTILLRDVLGADLDRVPVLAGPGPNKVTLSRNPGVTIRGRDTARGALFAFYPDDTANVRPWLITGLSSTGPYVTLAGVNYSPKVYQGDSAAMPPAPTDVPATAATILINNLTVTANNTGADGVAQYWLTSFGVVRATDGTNVMEDRGHWITPQVAMADYSARLSILSGSVTSGPVGSWANLASTRQWTLQGGPGGADASWFVEIRLDATGTIQDTATLTVHAERDAAAGPVNINNLTVTAHNTTAPGVAQYWLTGFGDVYATTGTNAVVDVGDWLTPPTDMALYSARLTIVSGAVTSGPVGAWVNLATTQKWTLEGGPGGVDAVWQVEIRRDSTGAIEDTATVAVRAEQDAPANPVTINNATVSAFNTGGAGVAQYRLTNTGDIGATQGTNSPLVDIGDWISPKANFGLYSARLTIVTGTVTSGPVGSWVNLGTTRTWTLQGGPGGVDATWNLEIRLDSTGDIQDTATLTVHAERDF
jgi:hypothetical protein